MNREDKITGGILGAGFLLAVAVAALCLFGSGCCYKGGKVVDGTNLEIGICIPGTEWSINALSYTGGIKGAGNQNTAIVVSNEVQETNSYFGVITMERKTKMTARIEPTEEAAESAADATVSAGAASATP